MNNQEEILLSCLNISAAVNFKLPKEFKNSIMSIYGVLVDSMNNNESTDRISKNTNVYSVLLNKTLFIALHNSYQPVDLNQFKTGKVCNEHNIAAYTQLHKKLTEYFEQITSTSVKETIEPNDLHIVDTFDVESTTEAPPDLDSQDTGDLSAEDLAEMSKLLENGELDPDDISIEDAERDIFADDDTNPDEDDDGIDLDDDGDINLDDETSDDLNSINEQEADDSSDEKEIERFNSIYGTDGTESTPLSAAVDGVILSMRDLYESCYSGITSPDGILTSKGLFSFDETIVDGKKTRKFVYNHNSDMKSDQFIRNRGNYGKYYKAVLYAIGVVEGGAAEIPVNADINVRAEYINNAVAKGEAVFGKEIDGRKGRTPKYIDVKDRIQLYPMLHTEFMTGYFEINDKMKQWAVENKAKRSNLRITSYTDMEKWMKKRLSDCFAQACIDFGVKLEDAGENDNVITSICQTMSNSIKNIIVITAAKKSHKTIKICTAKPINGSNVAKHMANYFNSASSGSKATSVKLKNDGTMSGVIEFDLILNQEDYDKSSSFSADVIDAVIQSGQVPSWNNAILGEKDSGGVMRFDFTKSCSIAIYGASGSGKGIMTSALLTNAMADGCEIFYFDGKPDNGAALAKVAWDNTDQDVAIFNGNTGGSDTFQDYLENYSHGIRDVNLRNKVLDAIPILKDNDDWPFNETIARKQLAETSLTLNAYQFVHDMILARTNSNNVEALPNMSKNAGKRWAVFVIDEIQDAAKTEKIIRNMMNTYMTKIGEQEVSKTETKTDSKGNTTNVQKRDGKIKDPKNWSKDTGYLFCRKWLDWADSRCIQWDNVVTKSLRNSSSTLITIFQSNGWLTQNNAGAGNTRIGRLMLTVAQKTTKIVGKGALISNNQWGDETSYAWDGEVGKGKWALAKGEEGLTDDANIFKPFKVFTTDLGDKVVVPIDDRGAGAQNCWDTPDLNVRKGKKPLGLQSYVKYLFAGLADELQEQVNNGLRLPETLTPEGVLTSSFRYFNDVISRNPDAFKSTNIIDYMYSVSTIENFNGSISSEEAEQIEHRSNNDEQSNLDLYNQMLDNTEEDDSYIDFEDESQTQPQQQNTSNNGAKTQNDESSNNVIIQGKGVEILLDCMEAYQELESTGQSLTIGELVYVMTEMMKEYGAVNSKGDIGVRILKESITMCKNSNNTDPLVLLHAITTNFQKYGVLS